MAPASRPLLSVLGVALLVVAGCVVCRLPEEAFEAVLRTNLGAIRDAIHGYERDGGCLRDLAQLVAEGYLRQLPVDPFAENRSVWYSVRDDGGCICDVRSTSNETAEDGTRYRDW